MNWRRCVDVIDLDAGTLTVKVAVSDLKDSSRVTRGPKSEAGKRTITIPAAILPDLKFHLRVYAEQSKRGLVFVGPKGAQVKRPTFSRPWRKAIEKADLPGLHVHDLRHTANTLAADTGASLKELMRRMGHSSPRAAMIYLHAREERDRKIADGISDAIREGRMSTPGTPDDESGDDDPPLVGTAV